MVEAIIKSLDIENFKGIKQYHIDFNEKETIIKASNGCGKTTIKNAWEWVLGQQVAEFIPKLNNKELECETKVTAIMSINGYDYEFMRTCKPKYTAGRKTSNLLSYYIDGIEYQAKNYLSQICSILSGNAVDNLRILTDKEYFNSDTTSWKWNNRRAILMQITGAEEQSKSIIDKQEYILISDDIKKGHSTSVLASQFAKEKKELKSQQDKYNILIEQKQEDINKYLGIDFEKISNELSVMKTKLSNLNKNSLELMSDKLNSLQQQLLENTEKLSKLKIADTLRMKELQDTQLTKYTEANALKNKLESLHSKDCLCPTCHQTLPDEILENITKESDELTAKYKIAVEEFNNAKSNIDNFIPNETITVLEDTIRDIKMQIEDVKSQNSNENIEDEKKTLESAIFDLTTQLARKRDLEEWGKQLKDFKNKCLDLADEIVSCETKERVLQAFMKEQTDFIIQSVNSKFSNGVSWSLYNENYNGNIEEDCVCMYNNKIYGSLSNGEKYKTNMEVLKTLQDYFDVNLPIWVDNAEAITLNLQTDRQIIKLYAIPEEQLSGCEKI